ncbi:hypothetical protein QDX21_03565 [Auritidibacter ignavus]|uniref:Uncharacterized protein n=1 Tax=Auritidibacter ignavus TaxID=678932 RepID=A0AAJ6AIG2_9MICC|nr:hypothetical protein [Auritidibacter ignavus]WGH93890.1 hypothetical protein QDX21_03565 [Auritidibacter ignavus]
MTKHLNSSQKAEIMRLWTVERWTAPEIADHIGYGDDAVRNFLKKQGVHRARQRKTAPHGAPARWMEGCTCQKCVEGKRAYKRAEYERYGNRQDPAVSAERIAMRQARTVQSARKTGKQWTGAEVEMVARRDLTIEQIATALGRTYAAVSNVRQALADPSNPSHHRYQTMLNGVMIPPADPSE